MLTIKMTVFSSSKRRLFLHEEVSKKVSQLPVARMPQSIRLMLL